MTDVEAIVSGAIGVVGLIVMAAIVIAAIRSS